MDHLPAPIDGERPDVHFYAKKQTYRPDDFFTLPGQQGYEDFQLLLEDGLYKTIDSEEANVFLQSWLFFALLAQVIGEDIDYLDFYQSFDTTLTTKSLNARLQAWAKKETAALEEGLCTEQKNRYLRASMALTDARRFVSKHCSYQRMDRDHIILVGADHFKKDRTIHTQLNETMTLSLAILGETLQQARPDMIPHLEGHMGFWRDPRTEEKRWGCSKWCRGRMVMNGYEEREIRRMESIMPSRIIVDCGPKEGVNTLGPLHMGRCRGAGCPTETIREDELVKIIDRGETPLVTFGSSGLKYKGYDLTKDCDLVFGALSHSWDGNIVDAGVDARGKNNRRLHQCQIRALQETLNDVIMSKQIDAVTSDTPFWVDVLCLPREPSPKGKAVNQIRDIYSKASAVIVWDRDLLQRPKTSEADLIELNIRIRTSQWSWRLWTLQETVLAGQNNLYVGFSNQSTVSIGELSRARCKAKDSPNDPYHHIWKAGYPFSQPTWELRTYNEFQVH
ncbi:Nn.00g005570.m01.CDS01 [Neocucurbitaria sp. VM-36]